jgi:hypothetical protein
MTCQICLDIANNIWCQGCSDEIEESCDNGQCDAYSMIERGSVNGHRIPDEIIKKYKLEEVK